MKTPRPISEVVPSSAQSHPQTPPPFPSDFIDVTDVTDTGGRSLTVTSATQIRSKTATWWIPDRLPKGGLVLLGGREGLGKSLVTVTWAAAMTRGQLPGQDNTPARVGMVIGEDALDTTVKPRLAAANADMALVDFITVNVDGLEAGNPVIPLDTHRLRGLVEARGYGMVILDPLVSVLDGRLDSHKDHSIRQALDPLNRLAAQTVSTFVGLVHEGKGGGDLSNRVLGSRAFTASARVLLTVTRDPQDDSTRLLTVPKSNLGRSGDDVEAWPFQIVPHVITTDDHTEMDTPTVAWNRPRYVSQADLVVPEDAETRSTVAECAEWLTDYLTNNGGEVPRKTITAAAKAEGYSPSTLDRAKRRAGITYRSFGYPRTTVWTLETPQSRQSHRPKLTGTTVISPDVTETEGGAA